MEEFDPKQHWEKIYETKKLEEVSWYQPTPETSLNFIEQQKLDKDAKIIDVGGGDSFLVDHLLGLGYKDITVLDISEKALQRAKQRLGEKASKVKWVVSDAAKFKSTEKYDFWHDRAAFHFLTRDEDIQSYLENLNNSLSEKGLVLIGTFSESGPTKCSGIDIKQYSESSMEATFGKFLKKESCFTTGHQTPSGKTQDFIFCSFRR